MLLHTVMNRVRRLLCEHDDFAAHDLCVMCQVEEGNPFRCTNWCKRDRSAMSLGVVVVPLFSE